jgi:NADH dehydrogenase
VNALQRRRQTIAVLARDPASAHNRYNHPVEAVRGNVLDPVSLAAACAGRDVVIHLVGIIHPKGEQTFDRMHREAVENVVAASEAAGARRYLHMSAMGAAADSPSEYGRTKAAGEKVVRESGLDWTIFRPSIVFGPGDGFVSLLEPIVRHNPGFIPVIGPGRTKFAPVSVYDLARLFGDAIEKPETAGKTFEVGGSETLTLDEIYREIAAAVGKPRKPLLHFPLWYGRILAAGFEWAARRGIISDPPLTRDQLKSLERDNTADVSETDRVFGGPWLPFRVGIRQYLGDGRRHDPRHGTGEEVNLERVALLRVR